MNMGNIQKICIIGGGNMGRAIAGGIAANPGSGMKNIIVTARTRETLGKIEALGPAVKTSQDNTGAAAGADLVIIAVKPWQTRDVLEEIRPVLDYGKCTVASVVAGISFSELKDMLHKDTGDGNDMPGLMRIIPNTAIALGMSTTFIAASGVRPEIYKEVENIFGKMGEVVAVPEEMMPAGTALASCGIAYALKYLDAAIQGGTDIGFSQEEARKIVINTMKGAIALLETGGTSPQEEIGKVTTPGGYTAKGLAAMEEYGFQEAVMQGLLKSMQR